MSVIAGNLSETLYNQNMKLVKPNKKVAQSFASLKELSAVNSMQQQDDDLQNLMPAFIQQAHLSTWFQDNPWDILLSSSKYGLPVMGGELDLEQSPGHKPGNVLKKPEPEFKPVIKTEEKEKFGNSSSEEYESVDKLKEFMESPLGITLVVLVALVLIFLIYKYAKK